MPLLFRVLVTGMTIGIVLTTVGALLTPADVHAAALAHRLGSTGEHTTAHGATVWHECTYRGCTGTDHVMAVVDLPDGPRDVLLHSSNADTNDLRAGRWSPASAATGYAGTLDVLYDPADPARTVMAADDVRSWLTGDRSGALREDMLAGVVYGGLTIVSLLGVVWWLKKHGGRVSRT